MGDTQEELEALLLRNRLLLTKVLQPLTLIDYLHQEGYLNEDEMAEIKCDAKFPSRRQKTGELLDIVKLKGADGIKCFLTVLGWECPNTYKKIMCKNPPNAPSFYCKNRESQIWDESIVPTPEEYIKFLKMEIECLEKENARMTWQKHTQVPQNLGQLNTKLSQLEAELAKVRLDVKLYKKESENYKEKYQKAQAELNEQKNKGQSVCPPRRPPLPDRPIRCVNPTIHAPAGMPSKTRSLEVQLDLVREQLKEKQEECEKLSDLLKESNDKHTQALQKLAQRERKIVTIQDHVEEIQKEKQDAMDSKNYYFQEIQTMNDRLQKTDQEKSKMMQLKHEAEESLISLRHEMTQLKRRLRESVESVDYSLPGGPPVHNESSNDLYDNFTEDVGDPELDDPQVLSSNSSSTSEDTSCLALNFEVTTKMLPETVNSQETDDDELMTIKNVTASKLHQVHIIGGNFTGIFIDALDGNISLGVQRLVKNDTLMKGDQLLNIRYPATAEKEAGLKTMKGCTLQQASNNLRELQEKEFENTLFEITVRRSQSEYEKVKQWMEDKNKGHGDFFFARVKATPPSVPGRDLQMGDIVLVRNTRHSNMIHWQGEKVNKMNGKPSDELITIPNTIRRQHSGNNLTDGKKESTNMSGSRLRREGVIKDRGGGYEKVLPVKAKNSLPVMLLGTPDLVEAVMSVLRDDNDKFIIAQDDDIQLVTSNNKNVICSRTLQPFPKDLNAYVIVLLVRSPEATPEGLRELLGTDMANHSSDTNEKMLLDKHGFIYDIMMLPSPEVRNKNTLIEMLTSLISVAQHRQFWLNTEQLGPATRELYSHMLDKPKTFKESNPSCMHFGPSMYNPIYSSAIKMGDCSLDASKGESEMDSHPYSTIGELVLRPCEKKTFGGL